MSRFLGGLLLATALALSGCGGEHPQGSFLGRIQQALGAPSISSFSPTSGTPGATVMLDGTGFTGTRLVRFNGVATTFTVFSDTQLQVYVPEGARTGRILVTNASGSITSATDFTVPPPPELASFTPRGGAPGTRVVLTGSQLATTSNVTIAGVTASFTVDSDTQVTATVPAGAMTGSVTISTQGGHASLGNFSVQSSAAPTITEFSHASIGRGSTITVTGTHFTGTLAVSVDGAVVDFFSTLSDTQLSLSVPQNAATGRVRVYNSKGVGVSPKDLVILEPPVISGFSPTSGTAGTTVTLTGRHFAAANGVSFNGITAAFTVVSDTQLTATVPAGATTGALQVYSQGGSASSAGRFTVQSSVAPTITTISPDNAWVGSYISISGSGFTGATEVSFNGVRAPFFSVSSDSSIGVNVPQGATTGRVRVVNTLGIATSANDFTVNSSVASAGLLAGPTITSVSPRSGAVGDVVTVTGSGFTNAWSFMLGDMTPLYQVVSDTELTFIVPPGARSNRLQLSGAMGSASSPEPFTVEGSAVPVIHGFTPTRGNAFNSVNIYGAYFTGVTEVTFNGVPVSSFWLSDGRIQTTVPNNVTTGRIRITNSKGTATSSTDFVLLPAPTISDFSPESGPEGTAVTVTGTGFDATYSVFVGSVRAAFQVVSDTELTVFVPAGASNGGIGVLTFSNSVYSTKPFSTQATVAPTISRLSKPQGGAGAEVILFGTGFGGTSEVRFNGTTAFFHTRGDGELRTNVPTGATSGPIEVRNAAGSASSASFTVIPPPSISSFSPTRGPAGATVTLTGVGFTGATGVLFGGQYTSEVTALSDTQMTAVVPVGALGGKITVFSASGQGVSATSFTVESSCVPTITSFNPEKAARGTRVEVTGTCFTGLTGVEFNGVAAQGYYLTGDTRLDAYVPYNATTGPLRVTNTLGSASSSTSFTVIPPPSITTITPSRGKAGDTITLTGSGFEGTYRVGFPNNIDAEFTVVSDTEMTAVVPIGATSGGLFISAPGGSGSSQASFTVLSTVAPVVDSFSPTRAGAGATVEVRGSGFTGTTGVSINGVPAFSLDVRGDTVLRVNVPNGATTGRLRVTNTVGTGSSATDFVVIPPPTISGFTPTRGTPGTRVTMTGTGLAGTTEVRLNGADVAFTVVDDSTLTLTVPGGASSGSFEVYAEGGRNDSPLRFTVLSTVAPTVTGFTPTSGGPRTYVQLTGTGFTGAQGVSFNGALASSFYVISDTAMSVLVPDSATTGKVTVHNSVGAATSSGTFTILPPPLVSSFSPTSGTVGTTVTLTGSGFTGATGVFFNDYGTPFQVEGDTRITVTVPAGASSGRITVEGVGGRGSTSTSFTVLSSRAPTLTAFSPTRGGRGTFVTLSGSGFTGTTAVRFNGVASTDFWMDDDTTLRAFVPTTTTGPITIVNSVGSVQSAEPFTIVPPPTVSGFTPDRGGVGTRVTVTGTGFSEATRVYFGEATGEFEVQSDTQLTALVPPGATTSTLRVRTVGGSGYSTSRFTVVSSAVPSITSFSPARGSEGEEVEIIGTHFTGVTGVSFNGTPVAVFEVESETRISAVVPRGATTGPVAVTNSLGTGRSTGVFTLLTPPTLTSFTPASGGVGTEVTVTGTGFAGAYDVRFNGRSAEFTPVSDTELKALVPFGAVSGRIEVVTPNGINSSRTPFVVPSGAAPVVRAFSPTQGAAGVGDTVNIYGMNFSGTTGVRFNTAFTERFYVVSDSELYVQVPAGATTGRLTVVNNIGSGVSSSDFTVLPPPSVTSFAPTSGARGTTVTLTGSGFTGAFRVAFGSATFDLARPASFTVVSDTRIEAIVPAGAPTGPIAVETPAGTFATRTDFTVQSSGTPTVTGFSPAAGRATTLVRIDGTNLTGVTEVRFNGVKSHVLLPSSDTRVYAAVPVGATSGPITVVNGSGSAASAQSFTVGNTGDLPALTSVSPEAAPRQGIIVLEGVNLAGCRAYFSGPNSEAEVLSNTGTRMEVVVSDDAQTGYVAVYNDLGDAYLRFRVAEYPRASSVSPASGSTNGGTQVTLTGTGFESGATVTIGGVAATGVTVVDSTTLTATVGARASDGPVDVVVRNPTGLSATLRGGFTYVKAPAPTVASITPASGRTSGGTLITVSGANFVAGTSLKVGGVAATELTVVDASTLTAVTAAGPAGPADVVVTNPDGQSVTRGGGFTYIPAPTLTAIGPTNGSANGGTQVTLTGTGFRTGATVRFGGVEATSVTVASATSITATTPAHAAGSVDVVVRNPDGQTGTLANGFAFNPVAAPTLTSLTPDHGLSTGGTRVTLTGANFAQGATVTFGGVAARDVVVSSTTSLSATTGGHATGRVDVVVRNPDGQTGTLTGGFTYDPAPAPTVTSVTPNSGLSTGGTVVTLSGTGFAAGATVLIGGVEATNVSVTSDTSLTAATPPHAAGTVDVVVRNPDGQTGTRGAAFTYTPAPAPVVSAISPVKGSSTGGTVVTVTGSNFVPGATVLLGSTPATNVSFSSATTLTASTPAHTPGAVDVVVRNPDGQAGTKSGAFTYEAAPAPLLSTISPTHGPASGGTQVTLIGNNFAAGALVMFDGVRGTNVELLSANILTVTTPAHAPGAVDVLVLNLDGQSVTRTGGFTYDVPPAPAVVAISPSHGPSSGGTLVTLAGRNFGAGATVTFGGVAATNVTVASATSLTAVAPAHAAGAVDVVVRNADGQTGSLPGGYTYDVAPAPVLTALTPVRGSTNGGTLVTLSGNNFAAGATVTFGGVAASNVLVASATSLTATTPAHAPGAVDVAVRNPDGQSATLANAFTYEAPPRNLVLTAISPASGPTSGGTQVTLAGNGFAPGITVTLGGVAATNVVVASETSLTATTPAHAAGAVEVVVTNPDTTRATLANAFTYVQAPAPTVASLNPSTGPTAGGTTVTIVGANFVAGAHVRIGGVDATSVTVASASSITAVTPPHAAGAVEVVVTNPDGQAGALGNGFTYADPQQPPPTPGGGDDDEGGCSSTGGGPLSAAPLVLLGLGLLLRRRRVTV